MPKHIKSIQDLPSVAVKKFNKECAGKAYNTVCWITMYRKTNQGSEIKIELRPSKEETLNRLRHLRNVENMRWVFVAKMSKDKEKKVKPWKHPLLNNPETEER